MISISCERRFPQVQDLPVQHELPDPFKMLDGTPIRTKEDWLNKRRPELKLLFQHYVYGYLPPKPPLEITIQKLDTMVFKGLATYKEVVLNLELPANQSHSMHMSVFIPNEHSGPVPIFVALNACGNHTLTEYEGISVVEHPWQRSSCVKKYAKRGSRAEFWAVENIIRRGYALTTFCVAAMDPDRHDWTDGIHAKYHYAPEGEETQWGTLAAWAWGIHRVIDYLETDTDIDQDRICATGWSRRGKAALFAAAMDERIDLVIPHQSGTGGMALSRMEPEESVARINQSFPHWFNDNFASFDTAVSRLPVDQHLLIALVAPRPLLDCAGLQDTWASPHLALEAMKAAAPVYELLGESGIVGQGFAVNGIRDVDMGRMLQLQRDTEHTLNMDYWNAMMDFADRQLPKTVSGE
ncbi:acetylxylan esterase [Candidatus Neomarinimicrobiota bacterium]